MTSVITDVSIIGIVAITVSIILLNMAPLAVFSKAVAYVDRVNWTFYWESVNDA